MIKIFRQIRQKMLTQNKFSKYLIYAIGEIILVVIGILIALQINNWNENRKLYNTIKSVYYIIQSDLITDIETIDEVLSLTATKDSVFKRIINKDITYDDYIKCKDCISFLFGFPDITLSNRGIKLLEENSTSYNTQLDDLPIKIISFYNYFNTEIDVATIEITKDFDDNYSYFKKEMTWFEDYVKGKLNDDFIQYALTSSDYRNRVVSFNLLYLEIYLGHLKDYKKNALILIENINEEVK